MPADADRDDASRPRPAPTSAIAALLDGATVRKVVVVPGRLVNFVIVLTRPVVARVGPPTSSRAVR